MPEGAWDEAFEEPSLPELDEEQRAEVIRTLAEKFGIPPEVSEELWADFGRPSAGPGDVRTTTLESLGLKLGQEFMSLFDYGDERRFKVRVHAIIENADPKAEYPRLVESVGEGPEQYPDWDYGEGEDED